MSKGQYITFDYKMVDSELGQSDPNLIALVLDDNPYDPMIMLRNGAELRLGQWKALWNHTGEVLGNAMLRYYEEESKYE